MTEKNKESQSEETPLIKRTSEYTFCPLCETLVDLLSLEQAAEHCSAEAEEITRLIQNRSIHCLHNANGAILVCFNSLRNAYFYVRETAPLKTENTKTQTAGKSE